MQSQIRSDTFPSHNGNDPISYYDPAFHYYSIDSESNPTSKQENNNNNNRDLLPSPSPFLSFFHFPSPPHHPFEEDTTQIFFQQHHDFLLQFHHQQPLPQDPEQPQPVTTTTTMEASSTKKSYNQIPRKRPCKRDRHSKINTARGLRDRRMRLSLDVAKRFFGLQDMLGFDKASKTVEWLLNQAKVEINHLTKEKKKQKKKKNDHHNSCSSASASSECEEGVSSLDEVVVSGDQEQQEEEKVDKVVKRRVKNSRNKISAFHPLAKECRERARERARERTREKMRNRGIAEESKQRRDETNQDLIQLGSWNLFETGGEESGANISHNVHPSLNLITEAKEQSYHAKEHDGDDDDDGDSLVILSKWSPSLIFNNSGFSQYHQYAEFQYLEKPWEA